MRTFRTRGMAAAATAGSIVVAVLLSSTGTGAQAAPVQYRQLDGAGLIGVLPSVQEAPPWLGQVTEGYVKSVVPTEGMLICTVGSGDLQLSDDEAEIRGVQAGLAAVSFTQFGRFPSDGYSTMIARISQFPSAAAAQAAWAKLLVTSKKCAGSWTLPYPAEDDTLNGRQSVRQTVGLGDGLFGSRSLVITGVVSSKRAGAGSPDRTGGLLSVWRHVGNAIYVVSFSKSVQRDVRSAVSVADRATINAVSALIGERYIAVAAG